MASSGSAFLTQTLKSISDAKMREHEQRRKTFEARKAEILASVEEASQSGGNNDSVAQLEVLLTGFKTLSASNSYWGTWYNDDERKSTVYNIERYLDQAKYDSTLSSEYLVQFEHGLSKKLEQGSQRFEFAHLYHRLLREWMDGKNEPMVKTEAQEEEKDVEDLGESFAHVQKYNLQDLKDKFSSVVFMPLEIDEVEIDTYMRSLFDEDGDAEKRLRSIREGVALFAQKFKSEVSPFNPSILKSSIKALLSNELLNADAKMTLQEISTNDTIIYEIADVLNLRFVDLDNWSWDADEGMYYEPRRQTNGKYRIMMEQDVMQALFLHYIAVSWSGRLKGLFKDLVEDSDFWKGPRGMSKEEKLRHQYFTNSNPSHYRGMFQEQMEAFCSTFLLSSLPRSLEDAADPYSEDSNLDKDTQTGLGVRQLLHRQIASDLIIQRSLYGEVAVIQSDLKWYATALPHSTIFAVLRFWGVPEDWLAFFKKFAEAPLRMNAESGQGVRLRKRGIPISDAFEKLFGECVLFFLDVAVNRLAEMTLFRSHDDLWLWGQPSKCAKAWSTIKEFVKVFGLEINGHKTGSVYLHDSSTKAEEETTSIAQTLPTGPVCVGMLQLNSDGKWKIDHSQVSTHIRHIRTQLGNCTSILSWIRTWNACMGIFFKQVFGEPANCFGLAHINAILSTYTSIQNKLFPSSSPYNRSVTQYLRAQIQSRFGTIKGNVPDAFFYLPPELGGLGLRNPFIPFLAVKDQFKHPNPHDFVSHFRDVERKRYNDLAKGFEALSDTEKRFRFNRIYPQHGAIQQASILDEPFFSFEEYTAHREIYSEALKTAYVELMRVPSGRSVRKTKEVAPWIEEMFEGRGVDWRNLSMECKWVVGLYAKELKERFGTLSIVDRNLLPGGVMKMLETERVRWQLIIWD